jgi:hypothetical protein
MKTFGVVSCIGTGDAIDLRRSGAFRDRPRLCAAARVNGEMIGSRHSVIVALLCGLLALSLPAAAAPARADVFGPDESIATAGGPLQAWTAYSGAFGSPEDIDYLYFEVPQPETLRFDVVNTLSSCNPYWIREPGEPPIYEPLATCPMWATLIDEHGQQLSGEGSTAGTGAVEYRSYEEVEWSFSTPGRYYLALESEYCGGHTAECQLPTFQLSYNVVPPGGAGTGGAGTGGAGGGGSNGSKGGGSGAGSHGEAAGLKGGEVGIVAGHPNGSFTVSGSHSLIESLTLPRRQRGTRVSVTVMLARRLQSLALELLAPVGPRRRMRLVGQRLRHHPIAGRERIAVPVRAGGWLTSKRYVTLLLRVRAQAEGGLSELIQGRVLLRR